MDRDKYVNRRYVFIGIFILIWVVFGLRLLTIQVFSDKYKKSSENISIREQVIIPARGQVFDRHGELMVSNIKSIDLMFVADELKTFDTLKLCGILNLEIETVREKIREAKSDTYMRKSPYVLERQIHPDTNARLQEVLFMFQGFSTIERTIRQYEKPIAAHTLGYIGEVNPQKMTEDPYYQSGDYVGISGIERSYEEILRGEKGIRKILKDKFNRNQGAYKGGKEDQEALAGKDLYITLDADLQAYGELLMQNKTGSIVAIEPSTGEILALVTSPGYDPDQLSGRNRSKEYNKLLGDKSKPLMNRALQAQYPPGSTFKIVNALIGEQMGVLEAGTKYGCSGGFHMGGLTVRCHGHPSPLNLSQSIQHSCNAYYCWAFRDMLEKNNHASIRDGFNIWRHHALSFGFGTRFESDLPFSYSGNIPTAEHFDSIHRGRWKALTVISLSIGQGEILTTPVQLANLSAIVANKGYYITPHIVKAIGEQDALNKPLMVKHQTTIDPIHFEPVIKGMRDVVLAGTARNASIENIAVCGKTGTAQNPHGANHSLFIAFAPMENPKIAISVIVENSGYGSTWASPIASLMIEKYLTGEVKRTEVETRMIQGVLNKKQP